MVIKIETLFESADVHQESIYLIIGGRIPLDINCQNCNHAEFEAFYACFYPTFNFSGKDRKILQ